MKSKVSRILVQHAVAIFYMLGLLIMILSVIYTRHFKNNVYLQYQAAVQRFHIASNQYLAVNAEARLIEKYYPAVIKLRDDGVLGQEHRLEWVETLQHSGRDLDLPVLQYKIGKQTEWQTEQQNDRWSFRIYYSPMHLEAVLLHEGDLQVLLNNLNQHGLGIYIISSCRLSRLHKEIRQDPMQGNIGTECELRWINIRQRDGGIVDLS